MVRVPPQMVPVLRITLVILYVRIEEKIFEGRHNTYYEDS